MFAFVKTEIGGINLLIKEGIENKSNREATEMGDRNIHNHENAGKGGFAQNPENINRRGANRKSFATVNNLLKSKGIQPLTKEQLIEFYTLIFNATEDELKRLTADKKVPYMLRLVIGELNNKTTRSKALTDLREYMFGKAAQEINHELKINTIPEEELDARIAELAKKIKL